MRLENEEQTGTMPVRHIQAAVTETEHERLKNLKGDLSWTEFLTSLPDGGRFERRADGDGRISLPASEYAGKHVVILVGVADDVE